jgi:hypothetical protein
MFDDDWTDDYEEFEDDGIPFDEDGMAGFERVETFDTLEEANQALRDFLGEFERTVDNPGLYRNPIPRYVNDWGMVCLTPEGKYTMYGRFAQPCYGEMRKYGADSTRPTDDRPGDLKTPFPRGVTPVTIGVGPFANNHVPPKIIEPIWEFILSDESPWRDVLKGKEIIFREDGESIDRLILHDTDFDPTLMGNFWLMSKHLSSSVKDAFTALVAAGIPKGRALFIAIEGAGPMKDGKVTSATYGGNTYWLAKKSNEDNFVNGRIDPNLAQVSFRDGGDYNRPSVQSIFGTGEKTYMNLGGDLVKAVVEGIIVPEVKPIRAAHASGLTLNFVNSGY